MKSYSTCLKDSHKNIKIADHMLTQTYPLIKDPKLLLAVMENVRLSLSNSLDALMYFMRERKLIVPFHESFESKYNTFKLHLAKKFDFSTDEINLIMDVKKLVEFHKKSPMEFSRDGKFVICSEDYKMEAISVEQMKKYIKKANLFLKKIEYIIVKQE